MLNNYLSKQKKTIEDYLSSFKLEFYIAENYTDMDFYNIAKSLMYLYWKEEIIIILADIIHKYKPKPGDMVLVEDGLVYINNTKMDTIKPNMIVYLMLQDFYKNEEFVMIKRESKYQSVDNTIVPKYSECFSRKNGRYIYIRKSRSEKKSNAHLIYYKNGPQKDKIRSLYINKKIYSVMNWNYGDHLDIEYGNVYNIANIYKSQSGKLKLGNQNMIYNKDALIGLKIELKSNEFIAIPDKENNCITLEKKYRTKE